MAGAVQNFALLRARVTVVNLNKEFALRAAG